MENIININKQCFDVDLFSYHSLNTSSFINFQEAQDFCLENNGNLARISSQEEHNILENLRAIGERTWLGIDARLEENGGQGNPERFTFTDGVVENLDFFRVKGEFPWQPNEPNDSKNEGENCVHSDDNTGLWNDAPCEKCLASFLCRTVDVPECKIDVNNEVKEEVEEGNFIMYYIVGGVILLLLITLLVVAVLRQKKSKFVLHDLPKSSGVRAVELSAGEPPIKYDIRKYPFLKPATLPRNTALSVTSSKASSDMVTIVSDYLSVDTTGVNYRSSF